MTPAARLAAAIEVLDHLAASGAPADRALKAWGKASRYAGSGDRRAVTERVYACLRDRGRLAAAMGADDGRALVLGSLGLVDRLAACDIDPLFTGQDHAPPPVTDAERAKLAGLGQGDALGLPTFIEEQMKATFGDAWPLEAAALLRSRAPLDIRVNLPRALPEEVAEVLREAGVAVQPTPFSGAGLRLEGAPDLTGTKAFTDGWFEVQDEGSQIAAFLAGGGALTIDYCAGGGGKTLALACQRVRPLRIVACDVDTRRLEAIKPRLRRAGAAAEMRKIGPDGEGLSDLEGLADLVLVDAPCSASGTWRRRPEAAWRLTAAEVARLAMLQGEILGRAAKLVRPGGRLAYVTCSVLYAENGAVAVAFEAAHPQFSPVPIAVAARSAALTDAAREHLAALAGDGHTVQLSPHRTGCDGFFIALFERSA